MGEKEIQDLIWCRFSRDGNVLMIPCTGVLGWEADMLIVTRALLTHEMEIKVSHADFLRDAKKDKMVNQYNRFIAGEKSYKHQGKRGWREWEINVLTPANYFWYVCPKDVIAATEVPPWAGLIFAEGETFRVQKRPKRLHGQKISTKNLEALCRTMNYRYWSMRLGSPVENSL